MSVFFKDLDYLAIDPLMKIFTDNHPNAFNDRWRWRDCV